MGFLLPKCILVFLIPCFCGAYRIAMENLTEEYVDHKYLDIKPSVTKVNQVKVINAIFKMKIDLPENTKISVKAMRWLNGDYRLPILQLEKPFKYVLQMEVFGLQSLWIEHSRPPIVWPVQKGVTYRVENWVPDTAMFPPNLPEGKYKIQLTQMFANKTKTAALNWLIEIQSK